MPKTLSSLLLSSLLLSTACSDDKDQTGDNNDTVNTGTPSATDLDGDGVSNENDMDADGDGIPVTEDCDDQSADLLSKSEDLDCDGTPDTEDNDQDGDGLDSAEDCDDRDPNSTSSEDDADCDGVPTAEDCDDANADMGSSVYDVDCDGHPSNEDCDDRDPDSPLIENDADCDGISNDEDAFPDDAEESGDSDGDGVGDNNDLCEGGDDTVDEDGNGVPDDCEGAGWIDCESDNQLGNAEFQFMGIEENEWAGVSISYAGDVDGDGLEDILIATSRTYVPDPIGRVYLVLGSSITPGQTFDLANADYIFTGEQDNDSFGLTLAAIGDYDGDGLDDLAFGAKWLTNGRGIAYMVLGSSLGANQNINMEDADTTFYTLDYGSHLGQGIAGPGDVNGDGFADILIGQNGRVHVILGTPHVQKERHIDSADFTVIGSGAIGESIAPAGDVDGDGLADFLFASTSYQYYGSNPNGRVHLMMGSSIGPQTSISIESTDYKFVSGYDWNLGLQVSTAGDVDGDGLDDILFGSSASDINGSNTGSAYLMLGSTISNSFATWFDMETDADYIIYGAFQEDYLAKQLAPAGDIDGDGMDDFMIGASGNDYAGDYLGSIYLFSGASLPNLVDGNEINPENADYRIVGQEGVGNVGTLSKRIGDIDGDGRPDPMVSSGSAYDTTGLINIFTNCD